MDLKKLKCMLDAEGINFECVEIIKNGVVCTGLAIITDHQMNPIVYYGKEETEELVLERIRAILQDSVPDLELERLFSRENLRANVRLCLQKKSSEDILKRDYLDAEVFVKLHIPSFNGREKGTVKMKQCILEMAQVSEREVFDWARKNTAANLKVRTLSEILGLPGDHDSYCFYVASSVDEFDGGASLCYPELFREFCLANGLESCLILPSSIHEMLILEEHEVGAVDVMGLARMVEDVNSICVEPAQQMNPTVYRYTLDGDCISIAVTMADGF